MESHIYYNIYFCYLHNNCFNFDFYYNIYFHEKSYLLQYLFFLFTYVFITFVQNLDKKIIFPTKY